VIQTLSGARNACVAIQSRCRTRVGSQPTRRDTYASCKTEE
jgi:hypothetical protein